MRAYHLARSVPWAITEDYLATILRIAARVDNDPAAVATQLGRPLQNTQRVEERGGVAIVPVIGPIFRYANLFTEVSGATSLEILARDFAAALADPTIGSILLNIDSPGGQANGVAEFAAMIHAARGVKPIVAYVGGIGASAAYWIASAADEIVVGPTAMVGSIGVIAAIPNPHAEGEDAITFVSSQSPNKRPDPTTEDGSAEIQRMIDALAGEFIGAVATYRGIKPSAVVKDFGRGGIMLGRDAVDAHAADRLGSYEEVVAELAAKGPVTRQRQLTGGTKMAQDTQFEATLDATTVDTQLAARLAELEAKLATEASARAAAEEQALALAANVAVLTADARRKRFKDEVTGASNDGVRWLGGADENVETLETLADALGEDSPKFGAFVQRERERATQMRAANGPLKEVGSSATVTSEQTAMARLDIEANKLMATDSKLTIEAARAQVLQSNAPLRDDILAEQQKKGGK